MELRVNKKSKKLYNMLQQVTFERVVNSGFRIPNSRFHVLHTLQFPVSVRRRLRTADCGLQTADQG